MADGAVAVSEDGRVLYANPAAHRLLSPHNPTVFPLEQPFVVGFYLPDKTTPYSSSDFPLARAARGETFRVDEIYCRHEDGARGRWLSASASPLESLEHGLRGGIVVFRDITESKRASQNVQLLSNAVEETADSVIITDATGVVRYANSAFETTTGFTRSELLGRTPNLLNSGVHPEEFFRGMWETLLGGRVFQATITNRKKNGELFVSRQTITPMRNSAGQIIRFVSVGKDITELQRAAQREGQLMLARSLQQKRYPAAAPGVPGFDLAGVAIPADVTGGDYFDYIPLRDNRLGIVIGDASGHGFDSALLMAETRAYARSAGRTRSDPGALLSMINPLLEADGEDDSFVTMLFVALDPRTRRLRYANAGHTTGYVLAGSGAIRSELKSGGFPLGMFGDVAYPTRETEPLESGDVLVLLTDGVTEAMTLDESMFGVERALELIRGHRLRPAKEIVERLLDGVRDFARKRALTDDMTALICKCL